MENSQLPGHSNLLANPRKLKTNGLVTVLLANHGKLIKCPVILTYWQIMENS